MHKIVASGYNGSAFDTVRLNPGARLGKLVHLLVCLCLLTFPAMAQANRIIDGDTLKLLDQTYRLHGIDAPELDQLCNAGDGTYWRCGTASKAQLISLIDNKPIVCLGRKKDRYQRTIAICYRDTLNLNAEMVRSGYAWAYRKYAHDYVAQEDEARAKRIGIWIASTQTAQDYRQGKRWTPTPSSFTTYPAHCLIKGNISSRGRIYHRPNSPWYKRTKIDHTKGERWFCTERDAIASGWRAAQMG